MYSLSDFYRNISKTTCEIRSSVITRNYILAWCSSCRRCGSHCWRSCIRENCSRRRSNRKRSNRRWRSRRWSSRRWGCSSCSGCCSSSCGSCCSSSCGCCRRNYNNICNVCLHCINRTGSITYSQRICANRYSSEIIIIKSNNVGFSKGI